MQYHLEAKRGTEETERQEKKGRVALSKLYLLGFPSYPVVK